METENSSKQKMNSNKSLMSEDNMSLSGNVDGSVKKKKGGGHSGGGSSSCIRCCQAEKCTIDLTEAKQYYRRHKVCELHAKAQVVVVAGTQQRFCQQCSRFHELSEFDDAKRSCRRRLAGHNERRRKSSIEFKGSGRDAITQVDEKGGFEDGYGREFHL